MMKAALALLFTLSLTVLAGAQAPCPSSEACSGTAKAASPFLEAAKAAPAAKKPAPKPAAAPAAVKTAAEPLPPPAAAEAAPVAQVPAAGGPFSKPLWSLFAAALVAGLYFYLKDSPSRGKKK
jgi:hypothetical protein